METSVLLEYNFPVQLVHKSGSVKQHPPAKRSFHSQSIKKRKWCNALRLLAPPSPTQFNMPLVPGVVCTAFSIELGFKALVAKTIVPPKVHDLRKLFELLPQTVQDRVVTACSPTRASFDASIAAVANVFEEWRYIYEKQEVQLDMAFLQRLADTVYTIINETAL